MSALGQKTLVSLLTERDSIEVVAREGLDLECVPNEELRRVVQFSLDYFHRSGRTKAPSEAVLRVEYGDLLDDHEIDFDNVSETVEWALDDLKGTFVHKQVATFNKTLATAMAEADNGERVEVATRYASDFIGLTMRLESREVAVDAREGMRGRLEAYDERVATGNVVSGMTFEMEMVDTYTGGVRDGELACLAAGPKTGKSYFLNDVAQKEHKKDRATCIFTLENSVDMTLDRIACLSMGMDPREWDRGAVTPEQIADVRLWVEDLERSDTPLWVLQPPPGKRSVEAMVREAQLRGAQSLLIDQLTFIEPPDESKPRHLQIREITHSLKNMINTGRDKMPCLLAHQINREGVKAADKVGYLEMFHLAEGSEVERTCDWVFGLYRTRGDIGMDQAKFQTLATRREVPRNYQLEWMLSQGRILSLHEILDLAA